MLLLLKQEKLNSLHNQNCDKQDKLFQTPTINVCSSQNNQEKPLNKQVNKNPTTLVRIDVGLHRLLKIKAATEKTTIRTLVEGALAELLEAKWTD